MNVPEPPQLVVEAYGTVTPPEPAEPPTPTTEDED